jgi:hypothetical protein
MELEQVLNNCSKCPHQIDCHKVGSCLEDINAHLATHRNQIPRLMTPTQATTFMSRLRAGESVRRLTCGSKEVGKALATPINSKRIVSPIPNGVQKLSALQK